MHHDGACSDVVGEETVEKLLIMNMLEFVVVKVHNNWVLSAV